MQNVTIFKIKLFKFKHFGTEAIMPNVQITISTLVYAPVLMILQVLNLIMTTTMTTRKIPIKGYQQIMETAQVKMATANQSNQDSPP